MPIGYIQMYPVDSEWKTLYGYEASQNVWGWINFWRTNLLGKRNGTKFDKVQLHTF